jgi:hypothetical protein
VAAGTAQPGVNGIFADTGSARRAVSDPPDLRALFHRLNNQVGIILAHAELLEAKSLDPANRSRAAQIVASALDVMGTVRDVRDQVVLPSSDEQ